MKKLAVFLAFFAFSRGGAQALVPANVHFDYNTPNSVSVSWDGGAGDNFWAVLSDEELFDTPISSEAVGSTFSRVYPGLKANATYYFKIKFAAEDDSQYSVPIASAIAAVPPWQAEFSQVYHSSVSAQWSTIENSVLSQYQAEADIDPAFMLGMSFSSGPVSSALFSGFTADTTVYLRVRTLGLVGADSLYTAAASTVTLAYPPGSEAYALVSSTGLSVFWDSNGNPGWTKYELTVSTAEGFATVNYSTSLPANYYEAAGLLPNTTYYFKALAVNGSGARTAHTVFSPALTYAAVPGANPPELYDEDDVSVQTRWSANDNPVHTEYYVQASTAADFTGQDYGPGTWAVGPARGVGGLDSGLLYHFRVRARDALGRYSQWRELGSRATQAGADSTPPSVTDQQGGDDTWRGSAGGAYDVDFSDLGAGGLGRRGGGRGPGGGSAAALERHQALFDQLAQRLYHPGPVGLVGFGRQVAGEFQLLLEALLHASAQLGQESGGVG